MSLQIATSTTFSTGNTVEVLRSVDAFLVKNVLIEKKKKCIYIIVKPQDPSPPTLNGIFFFLQYTDRQPYFNSYFVFGRYE